MSTILAKNERYYPTQHSLLEPICVKVVLVAGAIGDYAAYAGIGSDEFVASNGDKISFDEAQIHFPIGLEREKYRD